jgi:hypothetical protein
MFAFARIADPNNPLSPATTGEPTDQIFKPMSPEKKRDVFEGRWNTHFTSASDAVSALVGTLAIDHAADPVATETEFKKIRSLQRDTLAGEVGTARSSRTQTRDSTPGSESLSGFGKTLRNYHR